MKRRVLLKHAVMLPLVGVVSAPIPPLIITPEQYGAIGDGIADDTAAMQLAFGAAAAGGVVQLGSRVYRITSALTVHQELTIRGTGHYSVIAYDGPASGCALSFVQHHGGRVSDLMLRGTVGTGMLFDSAYSWTLDNLAITGFDVGVSFIHSAADNLLLHAEIKQCRIGVLANAPTNTIRDGAITYCATGVKSSAGSGSAIIAGVGFAMGDRHIDLVAPGQGWVICDCWMENSLVGNIRLGDGAFGPWGAVVQGNVMHTTGAANIELNGGATQARIHDNTLSGPHTIAIAAAHIGAIVRDNIVFGPGMVRIV